ncbi:inosamine-phosphate amidinotransferase [Streptomyces ruber]|uniref:Inosamine-phosphate amidinotransferase n=2 Tax=Streptomyces TaxID=1883 RepID=A0A918BKF6_9ACTN|nr:glycine amidinotransferase [Streptomyces ruber]GGQ72948.1 inosamine-phosphate amidinotransferase [Streptomyces ruber]
MRLNSHDEWSPLREVVLGSAAGYRSHVPDLSFDLFFYENLTQDNADRSHGYYPRLTGVPSTGEPRPSPRLTIKERYVDELNEDVEGMAATLRSLDVIVHRPMDVMSTTGDVRTPAWSAPVLPPLNLRDNTLILGDEIIETPPMLRARYFETQFLKRTFTEYFRQGARWTTMPRPLMTDASFDLAPYGHRAIGSTEAVSSPRSSPYDVGLEMMIDAAQCLRLGRDLVVNVATVNHAMACDWLERHLSGRVRVHRMHHVTDGHIDSAVLALRPGVLLVRSPDLSDRLPSPLRKWKMIVAPEPRASDFPSYEDDDLILTSRFIDLNVLSVSPDTVLANEGCPDLMRMLEGHGFTVVPVRHRHRRLFGGGLHCFTLDTVRDGGCDDYL